MSVSELEHFKLKLDMARLKKAFLETQSQTIQAQHQLVVQEIEKLESEVSILEQATEEQKKHGN
jgi:hypothetical protein